jgi:protein-disulfide isomerase
MNVKANLVKGCPIGVFGQPLRLWNPFRLGNIAHFTQKSLRGFLVTLAMIAMTGYTQAVFAAEPSGTMPKGSFEAGIREYLLKHPEVIVEALKGMEQRQREEAKKRSREALAAYSNELLHDLDTPTAGNKKGSVSVVEFFDYRCPHCKSVAPTIKKILAGDSGIKLIYKEFPILGKESLIASQAAIAAHAQGQYVPFHDALMASSEPLSLPVVLRIAREVGLDVARLQEDMNRPEIEDVIRQNYALAQSLGVTGTPAFVIGAEVIPGAIDYSRFKALVAGARQHTAQNSDAGLDK